MAKSMLCNMLPEHLLQQLEDTKGLVLASEERSVSILFCDIVDFHEIVANVSQQPPRTYLVPGARERGDRAVRPLRMESFRRWSW